MSVKIIHGNIFDSKAPVLVNPVNCVGVMGKGLAKEFKDRYPDMFKAYKELCDRGDFGPSLPFPLYLYKNDDCCTSILLFPTKMHWNNPSTLRIIESGLREFVNTYEMHGIKHIAFPALGCGCGGLSWNDVRPLMVKYLANLPIKVEVYIK